MVIFAEETVVIREGESMESARTRLIEGLKDRLWKEVWRDEIVLPDVDIEVAETEDGKLIMRAEIKGSGG